jgi:hypothetical protein
MKIELIIHIQNIKEHVIMCLAYVLSNGALDKRKRLSIT